MFSFIVLYVIGKNAKWCNTQQTFTCTKLTIEILQKVGNIFKDNNKNTRILPMTSGTFTVNFEHILHLFLAFLSLYLSEQMFPV